MNAVKLVLLLREELLTVCNVVECIADCVKGVLRTALALGAGFACIFVSLLVHCVVFYDCSLRLLWFRSGGHVGLG